MMAVLSSLTTSLIGWTPTRQNRYKIINIHIFVNTLAICYNKNEDLYTTWLLTIFEVLIQVLIFSHSISAAGSKNSTVACTSENHL